MPCKLYICVSEYLAMAKEKVPNPVESRFGYDDVKKRSLCLLLPCSTNEVSFNGRHLGNLKAHLKRLHPLEYDKVELEQQAIYLQRQSTAPPRKKKRKIDSSISVLIDALEVVEACVTLVTENGRPLKIVEDKGFRMILDPILIGLGGSLTISADNMVPRVAKQASELRNQLKAEFKNKFLCLKVDCAKRLSRSILGVNVQFVENGKIRLRTLAVRVIKDRQTGVMLKNLVCDVLKEFEIKLCQVYTVTTDNGANIVLAVKLLNQENGNEAAIGTLYFYTNYVQTISLICLMCT